MYVKKKVKNFFMIKRLCRKSQFWGCQKSIFRGQKVDKKTNFKGRDCKLDFPHFTKVKLLPTLQSGRF